MKKKEVIWREILHRAIEDKKFDFTQKEISQKYGFSLSTVFNALKIPRSSGAIEATGRGFKISDIEKFLYLWATFRNLAQEIIYQTHTLKTVRELEGEIPPDAVFGAFSAFVKKYKKAPADYDKVYVYFRGDKIKEIRERFPQQKGYQNLIVLGQDPWLDNFGQITPDCQTFVDLWNIPEWYAKDFLNSLKNKIIK